MIVGKLMWLFGVLIKLFRNINSWLLSGIADNLTQFSINIFGININPFSFLYALPGPLWGLINQPLLLWVTEALVFIKVFQWIKKIIPIL